MSTCYADQTPVFKPAMRLIIAITNTNPTQVTTSFVHSYITGTIVRLDIPLACGMQQISGQFGPITVNSTTTFTIPIDSTSFDTFSIPINPVPSTNTCAMVIPIGELNSQLTAALQNVLTSAVI